MRPVPWQFLSFLLVGSLACLPSLPAMPSGSDTDRNIHDTDSATDSGNEAPQLTSVSISPTELKTDEMATAVATYTDAEDDPVTLSYVWFRASGDDWEDLGVTGDQLDGRDYFDFGDQVKVEVTASDELGSGEPAVSEVVTIGNAAPTAPGIALGLQDRCGSIGLGTTWETDAWTNPDIWPDIFASTSESLSFNNDPITVETWWYIPTLPGDGTNNFFLFGQKSDGQTAYQVELTSKSGVWVTELGIGETRYSQSPSSESLIQLDQWNHIAMTSDGSTWDLWINGTSAFSDTSIEGELDSTGLRFWLGVDPYRPKKGASSYPMPGSILHSVRISDTARYEEDFSGTHVLNDSFLPDNNTTAMWTFSSVTENLHEDLSGHENLLNLEGVDWLEDCPDVGHAEDLRCQVTAESGDPDGHEIVYFFEWAAEASDTKKPVFTEGWAIDGLTQFIFQHDMTDNETWTCMVRARDELNAESEPDSVSCTLPECG